MRSGCYGCGRWRRSFYEGNVSVFKAAFIDTNPGRRASLVMHRTISESVYMPYSSRENVSVCEKL